MNIPKEYLVEIDGRQFVTYAGLLDLAHHSGLQSLTVAASQSPAVDPFVKTRFREG